MTLKILHRIYFGFDGKPDPYLGYLDTWKEQLPGYRIMHWNADNLPIGACDYSKMMYELRDHAFLSDYFRWWVLREFGGAYLDADIEVVSGEKFNNLVEELESDDRLDAMIGIDNYAGGWFTGHSMIVKPHSDFPTFMCSVYEEMGPIALWRRKIFYMMAPQLCGLYFATRGHHVDGMGTCPRLLEPTVRERVKIYPQDYFSPMTPSSEKGSDGFIIDAYTPNTSLCHHFSCSWHDDDSAFKKASRSRNGARPRLLAELARMSQRFTPKG
ncbi:glycosyltransferase [Asticcacaulis sp.]|uniref:glycosyltransferase n=1 Tax=Asticcacaulis sp. TaxID=1872648 RepID=UPI0031DD0FDE